jgi:eukaryotic-like serine/threonine-protein kinase
MNAAYPQHGQPGQLSHSSTGTLREALERRAAHGQRLGLDAALAQIVPLCVELAEVHAGGYGFYLHPSSVTEAPDGSLLLAREMASQLPAHVRDRACLPPETQPGQLNDARGNVYAIGAILYELLTGESVGQGMRRPSELVPGLPKSLEAILTLTLITDPARRPDDLSALAQSLHQLARSGIVPAPPPAPMIDYRNSQPITVDVSLSLLPPEPTRGGQPDPRGAPRTVINGHAGSAAFPPAATLNLELVGPGSPPANNSYVAGGNANGYAAPVPVPVNGYGVAVQAVPEKQAAAQAAQAAQIAELKSQLERDSRPRYFVHKGGMDHGPFTAVELVKHIDGHSFMEEDGLIDSLDGRNSPIRDWPQFAVFADYAKRNRQLLQRQKDIVKVATAEKNSSRGKTVIGLLVLIAILGAAGAWYQRASGERRDRVAIQGDDATNVETEDSLSIKGKKGKRRRAGGAAGSVPVVSSGQSCEAAMDSYNEMKVVGEEGQADITAGQYGRVLNSGSYFSHCGVPLSMNVSICAAVQNGRAVGVTVSTQPNDPKKASCISSAVRGLSFPSHPKLDVTRTSFASQ